MNSFQPFHLHIHSNAIRLSSFALFAMQSKLKFIEKWEEKKSRMKNIMSYASDILSNEFNLIMIMNMLEMNESPTILYCPFMPVVKYILAMVSCSMFNVHCSFNEYKYFFICGFNRKNCACFWLLLHYLISFYYNFSQFLSISS